jgi:hypothetical protein
MCSFQKCTCWTEMVLMTGFVKFVGRTSLVGHTILFFISNFVLWMSCKWIRKKKCGASSQNTDNTRIKSYVLIRTRLRQILNKEFTF